VTPSGRVRPRSLRSGPSLEKVIADVELAEELARRAYDADLVVAHHVEAAAIAHALRLPRWVFVAHTALAPELPTYLPRLMAGIASRLGHRLDRRLASAAPWLAAISPGVASSIGALAGREVDVLPVPIDPIEARIERANARAALGLGGDDVVVLYAGNLDRYQGLPMLVDAMMELRATRSRARLLIASESDPRELIELLRRRGVVHATAPLETELDRARAHAAADVAVVPRGTAGGAPIKLLDAVARGTPVVATRRAMSGASFPGVRIVDDDSIALAHGLRASIDAAGGAANARAHLLRAHSPGAFVDAFDRLIARPPYRSRDADLEE
jgi:glycosyltransferase involved in cell wall biosynthesis